MKTDKELNDIMKELLDWLRKKDLSIIEATAVLESIKLALNFGLWEASVRL